MFDECNECAPLSKVHLQVRAADGRIVCPHRYYSAETLARKKASELSALGELNKMRERWLDCQREANEQNLTIEKLSAKLVQQDAIIRDFRADNSKLRVEAATNARDANELRALWAAVRRGQPLGDTALHNACAREETYDIFNEISSARRHKCPPPPTPINLSDELAERNATIDDLRDEVAELNRKYAEAARGRINLDGVTFGPRWAFGGPVCARCGDTTHLEARYGTAVIGCCWKKRCQQDAAEEARRIGIEHKT